MKLRAGTNISVALMHIKFSWNIYVIHSRRATDVIVPKARYNAIKSNIEILCNDSHNQEFCTFKYTFKLSEAKPASSWCSVTTHDIRGEYQNTTDASTNLPLKLVIKSEISDTLTVVNHHRWTAEGLVTVGDITHQLQQLSTVAFHTQ